MTAIPADSTDAVRRAATRYRFAPRFDRHFVAGKLRHDPVYAELLRLAGTSGFGAVVDVGCGRGQLGALLLEAGAATRVHGLDWNGAHLALGTVAAHDLPATLTRQDFSTEPDLPEADTIIMIDILYQLSLMAQDRLLAAAACAARTRLILRVVDPAAGIRGKVSLLLERVFRSVWVHAGAYVRPRPLADFITMLTDTGFTVSLKPCWRGTPFANRLLVAVRGAPGNDGNDIK